MGSLQREDASTGAQQERRKHAGLSAPLTYAAILALVGTVVMVKGAFFFDWRHSCGGVECS